ncbi:MAG: flagellar basal body rod protein FlgF [Gammaproteobacteria bacterium]|jgi:flagellar basal-body rod protein FlgF
MDDMLYVAMSGAKETLIAQGNAANNLANASTTGFLADLNQFRAMPVFGQGYPTRVYALDERPQTDFARGSVQPTGRDLDVAVTTGGYLAVQAPDGGEAYTRRGDLWVDDNGLLMTGNGLPVIGNGGPVAIPPADKIEIGVDGTISIRPQGQNVNELAVIDRLKLVNPDIADLRKGPDGLLRRADGDEQPFDAGQRVAPGALESSNVNIVDEMVDMIEFARRFELQVKMMRTAEENAQSSASILDPV